MAFTLDEVVLWGRSFHEYVALFALSSSDLERRILGCGDGPATFNSILTKRGGSVVSVDPIYRFSSDEIMSRIDASYIEVIEQTLQNQQDFVWQPIHLSCSAWPDPHGLDGGVLGKLSSRIARRPLY